MGTAPKNGQMEHDMMVIILLYKINIKGFWKDNKAHGQGRFQHADQDVYEGQWAFDKANGKGVYTHKNGSKYEGDWENDLQHGYGVETWTDNSKYEGDYFKCKKHGKGMLTIFSHIYCLGTYYYNDGSQYTGEWNDNNITGWVPPSFLKIN